jgi:hypothetical protein
MYLTAQLEIRPMVLADLYPVFELGCELFSPEYNTLHRTWTEDEARAMRRSVLREGF